jgi:hypothetical protein
MVTGSRSVHCGNWHIRQIICKKLFNFHRPDREFVLDSPTILAISPVIKKTSIAKTMVRAFHGTTIFCKRNGVVAATTFRFAQTFWLKR